MRRRTTQFLKASAGWSAGEARGRAAFTLMEMLVVLAIIGILTAIALPSMKGLSKSNTIASASQQLLADLALARQTAIRERTTVHVVFVSPSISQLLSPPTTDARDRRTITNLLTHPYSSYAFFAERTVGDQPGQKRYRYIGSWRTLPDGVIIAPQEFDPVDKATWDTRDVLYRPFHTNGFPFPTAGGTSNSVAHLAFDAKGSLVSFGATFPQDEVIHLAQASVLAIRDTDGTLLEFDVRESPPGNSTNNFNRIRIDGLTGRARVEQPEIQ